MTSPATSPSAKAAQPPAAPAYLQSELYDSPADLAHWPLLAPLLRTWQAEVWEKDHSEVRGCWHYDRAAVQLQQRHQWAVVLAATMGTAAVVFAILQLGMEHRIGGAWLADRAGMGIDGYFLGVALGITAYGVVTASGVRPGVWRGR